MSHQKTKRREFLVDAPLHSKKNLPKICALHKVWHIQSDFKKKLASAKDHDIQMFSQKNNYTIVTADGGFSKKISSQTSIIIIVGARTMTAKELDARLVKISKLYENSEDYKGKIIRAATDKVLEKNHLGQGRMLKYK